MLKKKRSASPLCLEWIANKVLMYSTWNSAVCSVVAWLGGGFRENGYVCMCG